MFLNFKIILFGTIKAQILIDHIIKSQLEPTFIDIDLS